MSRFRACFLLALIALPAWCQIVVFPNKPDAARFAVIGDAGTGGKAQYEVGRRMAEYRNGFPFEFVLMAGDNIYGGEKPRDYQRKFEQPYRALLDKGVKFYAALGNHDDPEQSSYKLFNMNGERYYSFRKKNIRFIVLDSNYIDPPQLEWLEKELRGAGQDWTILLFHHPLYSSGDRHGSNLALRKVLEPLFVKYGVDVVFSGHDHFYERIKPQHGIYYFVTGAAGKLRRGDIEKTPLTAKGFDQDCSFLLVEVSGDQLCFQAVSRAGKVVDSGVITRSK
jgi:predicted phosphodiesterase